MVAAPLTVAALRSQWWTEPGSCRLKQLLWTCLTRQEPETDQEVPEGPRAAGQGGRRGRQEVTGQGEDGVHVQAQLLQDGLRLQV